MRYHVGPGSAEPVSLLGCASCTGRGLFSRPDGPYVAPHQRLPSHPARACESPTSGAWAREGSVAGGQGVRAAAFAPGADGGRCPGPRASSSTELRAEGGTAAIGTWGGKSKQPLETQLRAFPAVLARTSRCAVRVRWQRQGARRQGPSQQLYVAVALHQCWVLSLPSLRGGISEGSEQPCTVELAGLAQ